MTQIPQTVREEIVQAMTDLFRLRLITPTGGNISARVSDQPNKQLWLTPSMIYKGNLQAEMMVRIDMNGNPVGASRYKASSEWRVHAAIYQRRPDVKAIVHTHAPYATLLALTDTPILPISTEAVFLGDLPVVPFIMPGTQALADAVADGLGQHSAVMMQNHGLVVVGTSVRGAADLTEIVETTAKKLLIIRQLGIEPALIPDDALESLHALGKLVI